MNLIYWLFGITALVIVVGLIAWQFRLPHRTVRRCDRLHKGLQE